MRLKYDFTFKLLLAERVTVHPRDFVDSEATRE